MREYNENLILNINIINNELIVNIENRALHFREDTWSRCIWKSEK